MQSTLKRKRLLASHPYTFPSSLILGGLCLASIDVSDGHVRVDLAVAKELAHLHEENLVLIIRPLKDGLPEEEGVAWVC